MNFEAFILCLGAETSADSINLTGAGTDLVFVDAIPWVIRPRCFFALSFHPEESVPERLRIVASKEGRVIQVLHVDVLRGTRLINALPITIGGDSKGRVTFSLFLDDATSPVATAILDIQSRPKRQ